MSTLVPNLLVFGRLLRAVGFDVPFGTMLDLIDALTHIDLSARDEVFHTCRALLVRDHDRLAAFTDAFDAFWRDHANPQAGRDRSATDAGPDTRTTMAAGVARIAADGSDRHNQPDAPPSPAVVRTWSEASTLAHKDFADFSEEELARAAKALDRLSWIAGRRRSRRWVKGRGPRLDLRGALASSLRTGGDVLSIPTRRRRVRPRRLVLLCDVSGSMERYSRVLLHFAHGVGQRQRRLEVFLFSTGLTRVTMQLRPRRLDRAVAAVSMAVPDWSGGTRIGYALEQFHKRWARRVLREGPVVLLISDGWDRGDPHELRNQVARMQRSCHRLIWLNPLIGSTDYEPLTRGLQAALPFVDDFLPARTLADLGELALHLETVAAGTGRVRSQHRT